MAEVLRFVKKTCIYSKKPEGVECPVEAGQIVPANDVWEIDSPSSETGILLKSICPVCETSTEVEACKV
jgi:hypothetical protein